VTWDAVVGIGSNLGDRRSTLDAAVDRIAELPRTRVLARSEIRETAPVGPPQGPYLNGALRVMTAFDPEPLLEALLDIERGLGRIRGHKWGPRTVDLDILWIRGVSLWTPRLSVPHPHLAERLFALEPLVEVCPDAADPATGVAYRDLLARLKSSVGTLPGAPSA
jgi:2-amino-4-hydroxy-6-hydroxymethyldihydropteridine diphosphokinase